MTSPYEGYDDFVQACRKKARDRRADKARQEGRAEIIEKLRPLLRCPTPAVRKALKKIIEET